MTWIRLCCVLFLLALQLQAQHKNGKTYKDGHGGNVFLPMGDISFADEIISFKKGSPPAIPGASVPSKCIGIPNHDGYDGGFLSMGCGGELVVRFTNNVLIDIPGNDLYVFELGKYIEKTDLSISKDGKKWIAIGNIAGGRSTIDISPFCKPFETFNYVRLVDLKDTCDGRWPGADIDAIAAIGSGKSIPVNSSVLFSLDKATLLKSATPTLDSIVQMITDFNDSLHVVIEGHTDSTGATAHNQKLSSQRALAVKTYLEKKCKRATFKTYGYRDLYPVASNRTEEERKKNRRVEIILLPKGTRKRPD